MRVQPANAIIYPTPAGEAACDDYALELDGQPLFLNHARVSAVPFNQVWPGYQRPLDQTEIAGFASWDMSAPVVLRITPRRPFTTATVRPLARDLQPRSDGRTLTLTIDRPGQFVVEFDGSMRHALHCFANPPQDTAPAPGPDVLVFGPGVHDAGLITAHSGQTIHLAGGAVVYGAIAADGVKGLRVTGRGILDASRFTREEFNRQQGPMGAVCLHQCTDCVIDGITIRDPHAWTMIPVNCSGVVIRNVKLVGLWRYNSDGIDVVNSRDVLIQDCFVRAYDDCIAIKGLSAWGPYPAGILPVEDITVSGCVLWNDWGRCLEMGAETVAPHMSRIVFRDCDLIHTSMVAMDIQHGDRAAIRDVLFERIRVEMDDGQPRWQLQSRADAVYTGRPGDGYLADLLVVGIAGNYYTHDKQRGSVDGVRVRDIRVIVPRTPASHIHGAGAEHRVRDVSIAGLTINGASVTTLAAAGVRVGQFADGVELKP